MAADPTRILKRLAHLRIQRSPFETDWRSLATYVLPRRWSAIGRRPTPGEKQTLGLYDSTAIHANNLLSASLHGTMTSPAVRWFRLRMRDEELNRVQAVKEWLETCANRVYAALNQSNWNAENLEVFQDLGAFGTGAVFAAEREDVKVPGFRGMLFQSIPIGTYVLGEDADGRVNTLFRTFELSAEAAAGRWGVEKVGETIARLFEEKPDESVEIVHGVFPREGGQMGMPRTRKPFASVYLFEKDKHLIEESGYDTFPFAVPRWAKASGEVYGRGPGHTALPDTKTLNKLTELELRAVALAVNPPLMVQDHGVVGTVRFAPNALITVRQKDALAPLEAGTKYQVGQIKSEQLKAAIKDMFYNSQLQFPTNQPMTATETERRYEIMNRVLGPTGGRIEFEHTTVVVSRTFYLMFRRGALPPPPPEVFEAAERGADDIDIIAEGPLARAQSGSDALAVERTFVALLPMYEVDQTIFDPFKLDEAARVVAEATRLPARVMRSTEEQQQVQADRAAKMQMEQQKMDMERLAKSARDVSGLVKAVAPGGAVPASAPAAEAAA